MKNMVSFITIWFGLESTKSPFEFCEEIYNKEDRSDTLERESVQSIRKEHSLESGQDYVFNNNLYNLNIASPKDRKLTGNELTRNSDPLPKQDKVYLSATNVNQRPMYKK